MPGSFSNYAEEKILNHIFGGNQFPVPSLHCGYFLTDAADTGSGSEPQGGGYARVPTPPSYWSSASDQVAQNVRDIIFPTATGNHGQVVGIGLFDSSAGGNFLSYFPAESGLLIQAGDSLKILAGGLNHQFLPGGFTNYLKNGILNHVYKAVPLPLFPTIYPGYMTSAPSDSAPGNEPTSGGYARVAIANNMTNMSVIVNGEKTNSAIIEFPEAIGNQGSASFFGIWSAASGGQLLCYGGINPVNIATASQLIMLPGDISISLD